MCRSSASARLTLVSLMLIALFVISCSQPVANKNAENKNTPANGKTPADAKPMGSVAPGYFSAGPHGNVSLSFAAPENEKSLTGNAVNPIFNITGYPIYKDEERNKGQHIHVILDNEPYEADYQPTQPFKPESGRFENLKEGTHTLRAFPSREWHESIKQEDGANFAFLTFYVNAKTPNVTVDKTKPLLTYSRPKGEYRFKDDPRGLMLDFYVTNARISANDYKVQYSINGSRPQIVTRWEPVWIKWEELPPGEYKVVLDLVDKNNKPVPFMVGHLDYNHTERTFKVLADSEKFSSGH
ncbi:MAG: hypothetical protein HY231_25495 [Acidobacteria bacterium]|nr:hypothetical protein [Acidobacteriota bacterium]